MDTDPISFGTPAYYPLSASDVDVFESDLSADGLELRKDWFTYNGGSTDPDNKTHKKPLFFDVALNYVQLDMDRLQERAGKEKKKPVTSKTPTKVEPSGEKKKAKVEEELAPEDTAAAPARGGLSSLLGGWWGRT